MRPVRTALTIDTTTGPQTVSAWLVGDALAVHTSWAVPGWSITHCASGKALRSRIATKGLALDAAARVLGLPGCDGTEASIRAGAREAIVALLAPLPNYRKPRAPPRAPPT